MSTQELALKYDLLNSQMNPHFINNAIQSICNSITKGNVNQSINWLNRLSHLYRLVQKSTKTKFISLYDEIEISKLYIELQKDLFNDGFSYAIKIETSLKDDLKYTKVPPLIFQPLIENAIVHGLKHKSGDEKGELTITIHPDEDTLYACIVDNGDGISDKEKHSYDEASGISIGNINERLNIIQGTTETKKLVDVKTIKDVEGNILGTKSCLQVPLIQF